MVEASTLGWGTRSSIRAPSPRMMAIDQDALAPLNPPNMASPQGVLTPWSAMPSTFTSLTHTESARRRTASTAPSTRKPPCA